MEVHRHEGVLNNADKLVPMAANIRKIAFAREVVGLLRDESRRSTLRKNAYKLGREMVRSNVARLYMRSFELARVERAVLSRKSFATKTVDQQPRAWPELKLDHLSRMTDSTGLFQHAIFTVPNFETVFNQPTS